MTSIRTIRLQLSVFICGATVMIFEIIGSRLVAPFVGVSTYVWTSLIGVILASLSVGYWIGGKVADKMPYSLALSKILLASSWTLILTSVIKDPLSIWIQTSPLSLETKTLLIALTLFAPTSILLGTVLPFAARLLLKSPETAGSTTGKLYALSTSGSIFGTFLSGFYLIPHIGSNQTLLILMLALTFASIILVERSSIKLVYVLIVIATIICSLGTMKYLKTLSGNIIADVDTEYARIQILEGSEKKSRETIRLISTDPYGAQSGIYTKKPDEPLFDITKYFRLATHFAPNLENILVLGGSAYTFPRDFLKLNPDSKIDVVEIDPGVTRLAQDYFGLTDSKNLSIIHEDARMFLIANSKKYDAVIMDVFNSGISVPFHLTTLETMQEIDRLLTEKGALLINVVSSIEGTGGEFFRAEYATLRKVFPVVLAYPVSRKNDGAIRQNILVVALKSEAARIPENEIVHEQLSHLWQKPIMEDVPILTDDFAPVDYYMRKSI